MRQQSCLGKIIPEKNATLVFLRLTLGDLFRIIPQRVQLRGNRLRCRQFVITVTKLRDQLAPHFRCRQARVQAVCTKLRVGLALPIHDGGDIAKQVGEMLFTALAASR